MWSSKSDVTALGERVKDFVTTLHKASLVLDVIHG